MPSTQRFASMPGLALAALIFAVLTLLAGGSVLFGPAAATRMAGEVVAFVVWFNFLAGFLYLAAAYGLWRGAGWSLCLAGLIALLSGVVVVALGVHISAGGQFELRTPVAMGFRCLFWTLVYLYLKRGGMAPAA